MWDKEELKYIEDMSVITDAIAYRYEVEDEWNMIQLAIERFPNEFGKITK